VLAGDDPGETHQDPEDDDGDGGGDLCAGSDRPQEGDQGAGDDDSGDVPARKARLRHEVDHRDPGRPRPVDDDLDADCQRLADEDAGADPEGLEAPSAEPESGHDDGNHRVPDERTTDDIQDVERKRHRTADLERVADRDVDRQ